MILEKPVDKHDAYRMLSRLVSLTWFLCELSTDTLTLNISLWHWHVSPCPSLSGKEHSVFTGVAIVLCHEKESESKVYFLLIDSLIHQKICTIESIGELHATFIHVLYKGRLYWPFTNCPDLQMKKWITSLLTSSKKQRWSLLISQKICCGSTSIVVNPCEYYHLNFSLIRNSYWFLLV